MGISIQDLRERKSARAKEVHALLDAVKGDAWKSEHQEKYDTLMSEVNSINAEIKRVETYHETLKETFLDESVNEATAKAAHKGRSSVSALHDKWLRRGDNALNAEEWASIRNTMSTTTGSEGGYTVQTDVAKSVADALKSFGGMREVATVFQTEQGNPFSVPTSDGTAETGEQIGENTTATAADLVFGTTPLNVYKYSSKVVAVPFELLMDSSVDIEALVNTRLTQRIGRITNTKFTTGTGSSEPKGVVTAAAAGKVGTTGQTTSVIYDDLVDLYHSVDPAYRASGNCRFMLNDASLAKIEKIKDTAGRPIFRPGYDSLAASTPDMLMGYAIQLNQDMAAMTANAKSILFGDFSHYMIRDVMDYQLFRFTDSAYAKLGQVGFLMWARSGGTFTDVGGAVKYYQNSAT